MTDVVVENKAPKKRLKFIDMARTIAILLMLEGHLVHDLLDPELRDPSNGVYATWAFIRQYTASIFLTLTGVIFVFLLLKNDVKGYFENIRVKKGFKRVLELFFWGWLLQWYAFHVLECIGTGIFAILVIYGLYKIIRFIPLWVYFFVASLVLFSAYVYIRELPKDVPWPNDAWYFVQNAFRGPGHRAIFPIIPWMGYTMVGAMIGALLHKYTKQVQKLTFPIIFIVLGAIVYFGVNEILGGVDSLVQYISPGFKYQFVYINWIIEKMGMVFMVLGVLMFVDRYFGDRISSNSLFMKVGQNTLTIYIIHMMILYGSVIGIGLNDYWHHSLNGWEAALAATLFVASFVILIKYLDWIKAKLSFILDPIRKFFERIFFIR
ncbi:MAG: heparan-alpha-glucosaminide N-acetyltransferase domain-containing protein [Crocinitomicaceae bacterium]